MGNPNGAAAAPAVDGVPMKPKRGIEDSCWAGVPVAGEDVLGITNDLQRPKSPVVCAIQMCELSLVNLVWRVIKIRID